ncbi:uncharacterized protein BXZ73DRAFT_106000 [Epithele typhae]|uniref:uncharacterized protein n=1 Tax=Epithele typhae TaxID=378194 RepID=UPI002008C749|nr:uncharacterized protein BXZ73DRAFT_106000 [Epithele typhae]KAH9915933.1 hypothetical protein BXZ73DRAFT_106000 [Epithele typhae]
MSSMILVCRLFCDIGPRHLLGLPFVIKGWETLSSFCHFMLSPRSDRTSHLRRIQIAIQPTEDIVEALDDPDCLDVEIRDEYKTPEQRCATLLAHVFKRAHLLRDVHIDDLESLLFYSLDLIDEIAALPSLRSITVSGYSLRARQLLHSLSFPENVTHLGVHFGLTAPATEAEPSLPAFTFQALCGLLSRFPALTSLSLSHLNLSRLIFLPATSQSSSPHAQLDPDDAPFPVPVLSTVRALTLHRIIDPPLAALSLTFPHARSVSLTNLVHTDVGALRVHNSVAPRWVALDTLAGDPLALVALCVRGTRVGQVVLHAPPQCPRGVFVNCARGVLEDACAAGVRLAFPVAHAPENRSADPWGAFKDIARECSEGTRAGIAHLALELCAPLSEGQTLEIPDVSAFPALETLVVFLRRSNAPGTTLIHSDALSSGNFVEVLSPDTAGSENAVATRVLMGLPSMKHFALCVPDATRIRHWVKVAVDGTAGLQVVREIDEVMGAELLRRSNFGDLGTVA